MLVPVDPIRLIFTRLGLCLGPCLLARFRSRPHFNEDLPQMEDHFQSTGVSSILPLLWSIPSALLLRLLQVILPFSQSMRSLS